jgi:RNA polymerase sigma factor for flagellar operon FliA
MTAASNATHQLITENQGLVRSLAKRIHRTLPGYVELDDLVAYGQMGLAEAARSFDPARGHQFSTFAYYRIRGAIYDGLGKMNWFNRSQYAQARGQGMADDVLAVEAESQGEPSDSLRDEVRWLKRTTGTLGVVYLMAQASEDQDAAGNVVDEKADAPPSVLVRRELHEKLHALVDSLSSEAATLIKAVYFEGLTIQDAGQRIGVSKAWASRLHAKTLEQLARALRRTGVSDAE